MHDPRVVAFNIVRPWPQVSPRCRREGDGWLELRFSWTRWWQVTPKYWRRFWGVGRWELYWPGLITVWHVEPDGRDSGDVCPQFRRWALTRCEWCGGPSRRGDYVNISHQWDRTSGPWWKGERGLFHHDCSAVKMAHRSCVCAEDEGIWANTLDGYPYGDCARCGRRRAWRSRDERNSPQLEANRILASIPEGERDPDKSAQAAAMWRTWKEAAQ